MKAYIEQLNLPLYFKICMYMFWEKTWDRRCELALARNPSSMNILSRWMILESKDTFLFCFKKDPKCNIMCLQRNGALLGRWEVCLYGLFLFSVYFYKLTILIEIYIQESIQKSEVNKWIITKWRYLWDHQNKNYQQLRAFHHAPANYYYHLFSQRLSLF